ncbi:MAG: tol-pal system protein YbgF [Halioglobus sp.]|nr:tol-pal system protein YbgF [Halioglobus sp.]
MRLLNKLLVTGGLVVSTGPLCFMAAAQDYVDLEAEAAAREAAGMSAPQDPYGAQPAQAYPVTTYGVDSSAAGPAGSGAYSAAAPVAGAAAGSGGSGLGNLFLQVQQLQQEVMRLNGKVEEQAHELRQLKEQSLQRYMDLDKRLSEGGASTAPGGAATAAPAPAPAVPTADAAGSGGAEQPGEKAAYDAAYALVVGRQFDSAVQAFQQFLEDFPDGRYAPNAYYWLGELYLVVQPPALENARQAFALLVNQYPEHAKTADALYKLGKVQYMKGNREKARSYLDLVIQQYASSNPAVVKLARDFIADNNL